jgi:hypothetical protein
MLLFSLSVPYLVLYQHCAGKRRNWAGGVLYTPRPVARSSEGESNV